jgi:cysteine synthase A
MAQKLALQLGLAVGISSGANFLGALQIQNEMGGDAAIATVLADCNKKYLSTDLMRDEPMRDDYQSKHVELTGFNVYKRVCDTCCDMVDCELRPCEFKINS